MAKAQRTGVIRDYDMHSASVRVGYVFIIFFCLIMTVVAVFPIIWVVLAGFKDLKEFMSSAKLLPEVFDFSLFAKTWSQLGIAQNYLNSLISVAGSVVCAIVFNGLLGYGLAILKPKGYGIVKKLVTTLPAPITQRLPIVTPGQIIAPPPIQQSSPIVTG